MIDWTAQWREHAPNFADGYAHIDLGLYGISGSLRLLPGAGFGDSSHPTTRLVLSLMAPHIKNSTFIDIGCGSGILSLAALLGGAKLAIGLDIDEEALGNARANGASNQLTNAHFSRHLHSSIIENPLIVMNMISSEQRMAWNSFPSLHRIACPIITSGVLFSERQSYLEEVRSRGWQLVEESQEDQWSAFRFRAVASR